MLFIIAAYILLTVWLIPTSTAINKILFKCKLGFFEAFLLTLTILPALALSVTFLAPLNTLNSIFFICVTWILSLILAFKDSRNFFIYAFQKINRGTLLFGLVGLFIIGWFSVIPPIFIDHDSYYLPTIKWISEYGIVKGVGNLEPRLAYVSSWHAFEALIHSILGQSNLFFTNGYLTWTFWIYSGFRLTRKIDIEGLLFLASPLLFVFISQPTPDLPVTLLTFFLFTTFSKKEFVVENGVYFLIISSLAILIKPSLFLLPVFGFFYFLSKTKYLPKKYIFIGWTFILTTSVIFTIKNLLASGYLLYPLPLIPLDVDYRIPSEIIYNLNNIVETEYWGVKINTRWSFNSIWLLLTQQGVDKYVYWIIVLITIIAPFIWKNKRDKIIYFVYIAFIFSLYASAPVTRFFLPFILYYSLDFASRILPNKQIIRSALLVSSCVLGLAPMLLFFINQGQNSFMKVDSTKDIHVLYPHWNGNDWNTTRPYKYDSSTLGNLTLNHPSDSNRFFYAIGDAELPSASIDLINYNEKYFHYIPQMRTPRIGDGFYMKKIVAHE